MINANDARQIAAEASQPLDRILAVLDEKVREAAANALRYVDCFEPGTHFTVDNYRYVRCPLQEVLVEKLVALDYQVSVIREPIANEQPGTLRDRCFIRIRW